MKGFVVMLIIVGIWLAYKQHNVFRPVIANLNRKVPPAPGQASTYSSIYGRGSSFPPSGSASPGSGIVASQPTLNSTWGSGRNLGSYGYTAPTYK